VAIIGGSGMRQGVLLKHIIGLLQQISGSVTIERHEHRRLDDDMLPVRKKVRHGVSRRRRCLTRMTVAENISFFATAHHHFTEAEITRKVSEVLEWVELSGVGEQKNLRNCPAACANVSVWPARSYINRDTFLYR